MSVHFNEPRFRIWFSFPKLIECSHKSSALQDYTFQVWWVSISMSPDSEPVFLLQNELSAHINQVHYKITHAKCDFNDPRIRIKFFSQNELSAHINQVHYKITHFNCDEYAFQLKWTLNTLGMCNLVMHLIDVSTHVIWIWL